MLAVSALLMMAVQSRALPTEAEVLRALERLEKDPADAQANTVCGKFKTWVLGDFGEGMAYLAKSSDRTLKALAEHELDPARAVTPDQKVSMGDEWVAATAKIPALRPFLHDRACEWYALAWPDLEGPRRERLRERARSMSAAVPPGGPRKQLPTGWTTDLGAPVLDGTVARTGSFSVRLPHGEPGSETYLKSVRVPATGKTVEYSAFVRTDGTTSPNDVFFINYLDRDETLVHAVGQKIQADLPFWNLVRAKEEIPKNAAYLLVGVAVRSKKGDVWIDDVSVKIDGKETLRNGSFEQK